MLPGTLPYLAPYPGLLDGNRHTALCVQLIISPIILLVDCELQLGTHLAPNTETVLVLIPAIKAS